MSKEPFDDILDDLNKIGEDVNKSLEYAINYVNDYLGDIRKIPDCSFCSLKGDAYAFPRVVRGSGPKVMIVGEAPGREEAKQHLSFVGRSGKELDIWISHMNLQNYYITNVVKHRPSVMDRDIPPSYTQITACFPYLVNEITTEKPDFILALGNPASFTLGSKLPISKAIDYYIDSPHYYRDTKSRILVMFHPSYVLRKKNAMGYELFNVRLQGYLDTIKSIILGER